MFKPNDVWLGKSSISNIITNADAFYDFSIKRKGWVYAITHPHHEGLIKIGRTAKNPFLRAKSLNTAGVLGTGFTVEWTAPFVNAAWAESLLHRELKPYHAQKEFFKISLDTAKVSINKVYEIENIKFEYLNKDILLSGTFEDWFSSLDVGSILSY